MENERHHLRMTLPNWEILAVTIATLLGLCLRLYRLGDSPLVSLEVYTWAFSKQTVPFIFGRLSQIETNPPLYYALMHFLMRLGDSELILRLPSALSGTLAIPLVYLLGRVGRVPLSGVIGAALLALSAVNISYSREARAYSLVQDFCLLGAIGVVIILKASGRDSGKSTRQEALGWTIFTLASIVGFYLHYTFAIVVLVLELPILGAWLSRLRLDKAFLVRWAFSCVVLLLGMGWGLGLARGQAYSENISWMQTPSLREAADLLVQVDGYSFLYRFQPWSSWSLIGMAFLGFVLGWRRSATVLICGSLFTLFPVLLFSMSQVRPMFIDRVLVPPSFSVYLLAGYGCLFLLRKVMRQGVAFPASEGMLHGRFVEQRGFLVAFTATVMLVPAAISARNSLREAPVLEPYDKVTKYLASKLRPEDVAAGTDGVIYYQRKFRASFPYFKVVNGTSSEAQISYGSPTVKTVDVPKLANVQSAVYLVLREKLPSSAEIRGTLGIKELPVASFGSLGIYRLVGACSSSAPCATEVLAEIRKMSSSNCASAFSYGKPSCLAY